MDGGAASTYHDALCRGGLAGLVRVARTPARGRGLFAARAFSRGESLFSEAPLASLQHSRNAALVRACAQCMRVIGSLEDAAGALARAAPSRELAALVSEAEAAALAREAAAAWGAGALPAGALLPPAESTLAPVVPCAARCGAEYCSKGCRAEAARSHHALLCAAPRAGGGEVNAAALFERQALATNEIFILAGRAVARVLEAWARNGHDLPAAMRMLAELHSEPWPALFEIRRDATQKKRAIFGARAGAMEDGAAAGEGDEDDEGDEEEDGDDGDDGDAGDAAGAAADDAMDEDDGHAHGGGAETEADQAREWAADSLTILRALVRERLPSFVEALRATATRAPTRGALSAEEEAALFTPDVYERLVRFCGAARRAGLAT